MSASTDDEKMARLAELRHNANSLIDQLKAAKTPHESRIVLTTRGKPVAVLQEYHAYQKLLDLLDSTQRNLQIAEARERLRQMNAGTMGAVPLDQVISQPPSTASDNH